MQRSYEIKPGVRSLMTDKSQLFVVSRRVANEVPGNFGSRIFAEPIYGTPNAWISLLYKPEILGGQPNWLGLHNTNIRGNAERFAQLADIGKSASDEAFALLSRFTLAIATGMVTQPEHNASIDLITEGIGDLAGQITQTYKQHELNRGVLNAFLTRAAQVQVISA